MIRDDFRTDLRNDRLHIYDMFEGNIVVEEMDELRTYEYLVKLAGKFHRVAAQALKEAEKYAPKE